MMNFPSSGVGRNSKYFDDSLLLDGTYQITSVTIHSSSRDEENTEDTSILRAGLLIVPSLAHSGFYEPLSTADGKLNGTPTQYMNQVLVLARKTYIDKTFILNLTREREISPANKVVPAYRACTIFDNKVFYNNKSSVAITDEQWQECQRIRVVPAGSSIYSPSGETLRSLVWKREETFVTASDLV